MRVTVTAKGMPGFAKDPLELELPSGSTVATVLDLVLAAKGGSRPHTDPQVFRTVLATVNGRYIPASAVEQTGLATGDEVGVMPLIVGG
jgi:sulfur carrier protein ThiS